MIRDIEMWENLRWKWTEWEFLFERFDLAHEKCMKLIWIEVFVVVGADSAENEIDVCLFIVIEVQIKMELGEIIL